MNSAAYLPQSKRLLDQVDEVLRYKHYSLKTEQAYLMRHPRDMGALRSRSF